MEKLPLRMACLPCTSVPMIEQAMRCCISKKMSSKLHGYVVYGFFHKDSFGEYDSFDEPQTLLEFLDEVGSHIEDSLENGTIGEREFDRLNAELDSLHEVCAKAKT